MNPIRNLRERRGLTQSRLAELAGTSQPTIAAYEAGTKAPTLGTLRRLAACAGVEAVVDFVPPLSREDRRSLALHRAIAAKLAAEPEATLERAQSLPTVAHGPPSAMRFDPPGLHHARTRTPAASEHPAASAAPPRVASTA